MNGAQDNDARLAQPRVQVFETEARLQSGTILPAARVVYATYGALNADGDNAVVFPTRYGGSHADNPPLIGEGLALDPGRYFIVVPNMLGNGTSSSASNSEAPFDGPRFPHTTIHDNVVLQHRLLTEELGVKRLVLALGWSMGGQQAYEWAAQFPDLVPRLAVLAGAARTAPHTHVFLEGMAAALTADGDFQGGGYTAPPEAGLRAIGRAWAGWGYSQQWWREHRYRDLGFASIEAYLRSWEAMMLTRDANDLLGMIRTWQAADIGANDRYDGDYEAAMRGIRAEAVIMPGRTDLYFPPEDSAAEVQLLANGRLVVIPSIWGHYAGAGRTDADLSLLDNTLRELLAGGEQHSEGASP
jgi:homoserine O-acetyltransferase